jgi:RNA polymerase sigma factor (sigma-70 family)
MSRAAMVIAASPASPSTAASARVVRVLVVDDHAVLRAGVVSFLSSAAGIEVAGEVGDGHDAVEAAARLAPDVVLLDVAMPVLDGVAALPLLRALDPAPGVVLFTAWADQARLLQAQADDGTVAYVLKDSTPDVLLSALRAAADRRPVPGSAAGDGPDGTKDGAAEAEDTQRRLVGRACAGDADAWEQLYRALYPRLLAFARRRLQAADAADAVAETFFRAIRHLDRVDWRGAGFDGWVFGIARHVVADSHRGAARRARLVRVDRSPEPAGPLEMVLQDEEAQAARRAFARLSRSDQELLELRVIAGLSFEQTGVVLGRRAASLRTAQSRALARLRSLLAQECPQP